MPEEVAADLGLNLPNTLSFKQFVNCLLDPSRPPAKLTRFMPRENAECIFRLAKRKEIFQSNSMFSYYFKGGWMEFILQFDGQSRLRRVYIRHKDFKQTHEIPIFQELKQIL